MLQSGVKTGQKHIIIKFNSCAATAIVSTQTLYLFLEVEKPELGFPNHEFIQYGRTSARRAQVPMRNCMSEWLGEPFPVFQLPGRGHFENG